MSKKALIAGDRRSIIFFGSCPIFEEDLYSGRIRNLDELKARANELGASIKVIDGKKKVWRQSGILVGEVAEVSRNFRKSRRVYVSPGSYAILDIKGYLAKITEKGSSSCLILGNKFTQAFANETVQRAQRIVNEKLLSSIFEEAPRRTASVSQEYDLLSTDLSSSSHENELLDLLKADCQKSGLNLCDQL